MSVVLLSCSPEGGIIHCFQHGGGEAGGSSLILKFKLLTPKESPAVMTSPVKKPANRVTVLRRKKRVAEPLSVIGPVKVAPVSLAQLERSVSVFFYA